MANISTGALVFFLVILLLFLILYLKGKKRYMEYANVITKEEYSLRSLLPAGFMLMELSHYKYNSSIDRVLRKQLLELYEKEYVEYYLRATWAMGASNFLVGLMMSAIFYMASESNPAFLVFGFIISVVLFYSVFRKIARRVEERHMSIIMDLPDFVNKLLILSGAGLSTKGALMKASKEMGKETPFYEALRHSVYLMENGSTSGRALDDLTEKCNLPQVRRLASVVILSIEDGTGAQLALREIGSELWEARRAGAKRLAAEAETKTLFPMMLMFIAVILMVAAPAVMAMGI